MLVLCRINVTVCKLLVVRLTTSYTAGNYELFWKCVLLTYLGSHIVDTASTCEHIHALTNAITNGITNNDQKRHRHSAVQYVPTRLTFISASQDLCCRCHRHCCCQTMEKACEPSTQCTQNITSLFECIVL